ncbi:N-6 DNA methylase [Natronobacterium gregoryi SP2]|uniref:N-6 DNA methylase n=1 Tax=Natronobacterium gregoryi (strain ATCC 43098 / DSM 3393 / CCM 3738 / CIP 104747 / IAM 13177 / JCM 8860 / NBRC 102187 / NCIMB 2189 / SP2) TaxID=797304 RepID=L9YEL3_NATGS|nr:N-6 DNA methylase [Natronobacterium gregoryi SP2]
MPLLERSQKSYEISDPEEFASTLLDEIGRLAAGDQRWDALDNIFIDRVNTLHEYVTPRLEDSMEEHLEQDDEFNEDFKKWTSKQGIDYPGDNPSEVRREFAEQAAYLLINKIIFYKILESAPTYSQDVEPLAVSPHRVQEDLRDYFDQIVDEVDFEAVFEHDDVYDEIPLDPVSSKIRDFIIELDEQDLSQFDSDVIGQIYEGVIPAERRQDMGEYYTPPQICDLITRLTIEDESANVLDPSCGSGGFLVSSYHRLQQLLSEPQGSHERILTQISGVEINRFPAHLSAINLAIQDLTSYTEDVDIEITDFFDVKRYQRFERTRASAEGEETEGAETEEDLQEQVGGFDAVVGNPPYIRQENIDDKEKVRDHLSNREIDGEYISKRSDIYSYFITHATEFLADGGKLGYIISDRWLDTKYGEDVQKFLLNNYRINAIIKFDRQVFDDALVDSSVIILEKEDNEEERDDNITKFLRVTNEMDIDDIVTLVKSETDTNQMISEDNYRLVTRKQSSLYHESKWNTFFFGPPIYFDLQACPNVVELSEIAKVSRGITTGANAFFTGHTEDMHDLGLEPYTSPLLKATGQVETIPVTEEEASEWVILDVHDYVREALAGDADFGTTETEQVKEWLEENDHHPLLEYIESGEDDEYHERRTQQARDIWFDLGTLPRPKLLSTMFTWRVHRVFWNDVEAATSDQFYYIEPPEDIDEEVLGGILNSRIVGIANELLGRRAGGQGMTRLQTKVYETEQWPVPDPNNIDGDTKQDIKEAFQDLRNREEEVEDATFENTEEERDALDRAVLEALNLEGDNEELLSEVKQSLEALISMRDEGAGHKTTVLVERSERVDEDTGAIELPGVEAARESTTLNDFS